ncbi:hypothetical protein FACS189476_04770 [Spirochaetia bacterium]|nr:hypothetical protein FACS189476_04770 [Spirochaetia bacterium]
MTNELTIPKIQYYVTLLCNLNCKLCGSYIPYYKNAAHTTIDTFVRDIDKLLTIVNSIGRFELTGGEPILNPDLPAFFDYLAHSGAKIKTTRLLSNGRDLPSSVLLESIREYALYHQCEVLIDDYGKDLSLSLKEATRLFKSAGAEVINRDYSTGNMHKGGWVDFGITGEQKDKHSKELCANYNLNMHSLYNGIIYACGRAIYLYNSPPPIILSVLYCTIKLYRLKLYGNKYDHTGCLIILIAAIFVMAFLIPLRDLFRANNFKPIGIMEFLYHTAMR